jgi:hypothetical protein
MEVVQRMFLVVDQPWRVEEFAWTEEVARPVEEEEDRLVEEVDHLESVELQPELMAA